MGYGQSGGHCWIIGESDAHMAMRMCMFYVPLWLSIIYIIVVYCILRKHHGQHNGTWQRMKYLPMMLIICYLFASIRRIWEFFFDESLCSLQALQAIFSTLPGFFDGIIFGLTSEVQKKLIDTIWKKVSPEY